MPCGANNRQPGWLVAHELWLDYCSYTHGNGEVPPTDKVSNAILAHFRLTLESEVSLLRSDLARWENKFLFKPSLRGNEEVEGILENLKTRLDSVWNREGEYLMNLPV